MDKKPFYTQGPVVPEDKVAGTASIQGPMLGAGAPEIVPEHTGRFNGIGGGKAHHMGKPPKSGSHGFGHNIINRSGHVRLSGHIAAHRLGKK